jgi:ABC-type xylose transport system permease subunit
MSIIIGIIGRIKSFHLTEMKALVYNWQYWVCLIICLLIGCAFLISAGKE